MSCTRHSVRAHATCVEAVVDNVDQIRDLREIRANESSTCGAHQQQASWYHATPFLSEHTQSKCQRQQVDHRMKLDN
eukprot:222136-Amphidinium_carterae.2